MTNKELSELLVKAAYEKRFDDLMSLIDEHHPDFTHEDFKIRYDNDLSPFNGLVIKTIGQEIGAYLAAYCTSDDMLKILDLGCCPNSNNENSQKVGFSIQTNFKGVKPLPDKYASDSRMLLNAVKRICPDMINTLINYSCPCCNGEGAKVTDNLLSLSVSGSPLHAVLLQAQAH